MTFRILRVPEYAWYYLPPLWGAYLVLFLGLRHGLDRIGATRVYAVAASALVAILLAIGVDGLQPIIVHKGNVHKTIAVELRRVSAPGDLVAAHEVGNIAYWSDRPTLDLLGLTSPEVIPLLRSGGWAAVIRRTKPKYVATFAEDESLARDYRKVYEAPAGRGFTYRIWERKTPARSLRGKALWGQ